MPSSQTVGSARRASALRVTCVELESGIEETREVAAGDYCIVAVWPLVVDGVVTYRNGTTVLTLKNARTRRDPRR
jgi:hypothetical protein